MRSIIRLLTALAAVLVLAFAVAACGGDDEGGGGGGGGGGSEETQDTGEQATAIEADPANEGKTVTVGSKNFAEQFILGEIYAQSLEAAGFTVEKQLDLGSEQIAFRSLRDGDVDMYPEYTGTALTSFYRVRTADVPRDPQEAYELLSEEAAKDDLTAQPMTPFQNTFAVTSTKETAEKYDNPTTLTEVAEAAAQGSSISGFPECRQRADCYQGIQDTYNWEPEFVSSQGKFSDLDSGQAEFTFGFSTDGELALDKYQSYEDDQQLFPPYNVSLITSQNGIEQLGESGQEVIQQVQEGLTEEAMQELNSRVTLDKETPEDVAAQYLQELGYVN